MIENHRQVRGLILALEVLEQFPEHVAKALNRSDRGAV